MQSLMIVLAILMSVKIGNLLATRHGATPWRFSVTDYRDALAHVATTGALAGRPVDAVWDEALTRVMLREARAIAEEHLLEDLLADLAEPAGRP